MEDNEVNKEDQVVNNEGNVIITNNIDKLRGFRLY